MLCAVLLVLPFAFIRNGLTATAEYLASSGVVMVLITGWTLWSAALRHSGIPPTTYAGLVCLVTALIAAGCRWYPAAINAVTRQTRPA